VGVFDPAQALAADAPAVHAGRSNLLAERTVRRGDVAAALVRAAVVVEGEYRTTHVDHAFLLPEAGLGYLDEAGRLVVEVASQWPEADLRQAAAALGEPVDRLRLVQTAIGGAFGGREDISLQILLLLAARAMREPVHMAWDRAESVRGHGKRHPFLVRHVLGADRQGRLLAARVDVLLDAGCYASTSAKLLDNSLLHVTGPYAVRNVEASGRAVLTNNPFTCAMRGFGVNQVSFALEQQVNKVAVELGIDPAELRLRNVLRGSGSLGAGTRVRSLGGVADTIRRSIVRGGPKRPAAVLRDVVYGRGFATAIKNLGYGFGMDDKSTAEVCVTRRGAIVRVGASDSGQGPETVIVQVAAETLGIPTRNVVVEWKDSSMAPESGSSSASRQTMAAGNAVLGACRRAAKAVAAMGGRASLPDEGVTRRYTWRFPKTTPLSDGPGRHIAAFSSGSCIADVAVDLVTGQVRVLRMVSAVDAGRVMNPMQVRGQVEGGAVMGLGYALSEECRVMEGMPVTRGFEGSSIPTSLDAPMLMEYDIVESRETSTPLGARGIGEITMIPVVPAITAAIHDACGAWIDAIPATPERVRAALAAAQASPVPRGRRSMRRR
jgi:CO/xanthine dehydrogenase Mo-binding subunit